MKEFSEYLVRDPNGTFLEFLDVLLSAESVTAERMGRGCYEEWKAWRPPGPRQPEALGSGGRSDSVLALFLLHIRTYTPKRPLEVLGGRRRGMDSPP